MAEWLYEDGIGEARAVLVAHGTILEARIEPDPPALLAGTIARGRLGEVITPRLSARVMLDRGDEVLLDGIPRGLSVGAPLLVRIIRQAIPEPGRVKLPRAIPETTAPDEVEGPRLLARIAIEGHPVIHCHPHEPDAFESAGWSEVLEEAASGDIRFSGGTLRMTLTPAMTLFDVDGSGPVEALALAAAEAVGAAIRRHAITGSIGIDFPTLTGRTARKALDAALDRALPRPFERTAINGFGFVQLIRPRVRASLPEILRHNPVAAAARAALRRAERDGALPDLPRAVLDAIRGQPDWCTALARRTGGRVAISVETP